MNKRTALYTLKRTGFFVAGLYTALLTFIFGTATLTLLFAPLFPQSGLPFWLFFISPVVAALTWGAGWLTGYCFEEVGL